MSRRCVVSSCAPSSHHVEANTHTRTGPQGTRGPRGAQGLDGKLGHRGPQGVPGRSLVHVGVQGPAGPPARHSHHGSSPAPSHQGPQGRTGAQGRAGPQGFYYISGLAGPQGNAGTQGSEGESGINGDTGFQGVPGANGTPGANGQDGHDGSQGFQGPRGNPGRSGMTYAVMYAGGRGNGHLHFTNGLEEPVLLNFSIGPGMHTLRFTCDAQCHSQGSSSHACILNASVRLRDSNPDVSGMSSCYFAQAQRVQLSVDLTDVVVSTTEIIDVELWVDSVFLTHMPIDVSRCALQILTQ